MFDKAGGLNIVAMREDKLLILCRGTKIILTQLAPAQGAVDKRHGNGFSFLLAKGQPIATGELWRLGL